MTGILLIIAILPTIVLCWYINKKDKIEKEPKGLLAKIFFFGVLTVIPAVILELIVGGVLGAFGISEESNLIGLFIYVFLGIGLIEEGVKWLSLKIFTWKDKDFNHIYDAIVYATFTSLGFATIENILYVLQNGLQTGLTRAVLSVPGHAFFGVYMGYYYGIAKHYDVYNQKELSKKNLWLSILIPTLLHTFFDFALFSGSGLLVLAFFGFVIFLYITAFRKIKKLSDVGTNFIPSTTFVQQPVNTNYYAQPQLQPQVVNQAYYPQQQVYGQVQPQPVIPTQAVEQQLPTTYITQQPQVVQQVTPQAPMPKFCTNCGEPVKGKFCTKCGKQLY